MNLKGNNKEKKLIHIYCANSKEEKNFKRKKYKCNFAMSSISNIYTSEEKCHHFIFSYV